MKKICLLLVAGLFLFGCAKKEDSTETSADSTSGSSGGSGSLLISGRVAQGYVKGATVFADVDGDGVKDSSESSATTSSSGAYTLSADPGS
ncbi:MAG TPA: hypothetical protein QF683_20385 [SAR324 cluster bacterium]|nr:hypothetical protein [Bacteroidota bacterium]MDP6466015.1 hypothetical protein [SAR324 cluster bacterium]MDP7332625.1 hypothetical protein [SAR324 cluster bacterium]HJO47007.1 hypothetical protein [SAR324 cluster bacterium]|tara:strand:- start:1015 stop:1287 length:273 start_codon:yes stop_codon:yes gene_type:complete